jgi:ureidoacrylate peracid hydrolase
MPRHKLIVIGQKSNTCVDSTVRYAAELGYDVTLVKDAIASYQWEEMRATLEINLPIMPPLSLAPRTR